MHFYSSVQLSIIFDLEGRKEESGTLVLQAEQKSLNPELFP